MYEVSILRKLVAINTVTGNEEGYVEIARILEDELRSLGLDVRTYDGGASAPDGKSRPIIIGYLDSGSEKTLGILVHYDVVDPGVGWSYDPFKLTIREENGDFRLYGRGSADDKGCIAGAIGAIKRIISEKIEAKWNVVLMITPDEEIGGDYGAGYIARNRLVELDALLVADSSSMGLIVGTSGLIHGIIRINGVQGHAGYIVGSQNALHRAINFLNNFMDYINFRAQKISKLDNPPNIPFPKLWGRISLTWIKSSSYTYNIIPSVVEAGFDMRLIPEEKVDDALVELKTFFEITKHKTGIFDVELEVVRKHGSYFTDPNHPFVQHAHSLLKKVTKRDIPIIGMLGGNDGAWFGDWGIPIISFGVWDESSYIHGKDESASLRRILELRDFIVELIENEPK